jgi:predicted sulfurtransferase
LETCHGEKSKWVCTGGIRCSESKKPSTKLKWSKGVKQLKGPLQRKSFCHSRS